MRMGRKLSLLTALAVAALAAALSGCGESNGDAPSGVSTSTDGPTLSAALCADCHGSLANSGEKGATAARIRSAISANRGGMGSLSAVTDAQLDAIAAALGSSTNPPPTPTTD